MYSTVRSLLRGNSVLSGMFLRTLRFVYGHKSLMFALYIDDTLIYQTTCKCRMNFNLCLVQSSVLQESLHANLIFLKSVTVQDFTPITQPKYFLSFTQHHKSELTSENTFGIYKEILLFLFQMREIRETEHTHDRIQNTQEREK